MKIKQLFTMMLLMLGYSILAQDLAIEMQEIPSETPQEIPVGTMVALKNISTRPINLALGAHGLRMNLALRRTDGSIVPLPSGEDPHCICLVRN